ncbi:MAG: hypothetical protein DRP84_11180 [Spirochaetes bacterium]|nr:MAG: hypothetical protein DRP84_11180 [Spirochaetota bacterium]RKY00367.1 MAG: hypothetical protein DRP55_05890 [Spirochaetota bacterium]
MTKGEFQKKVIELLRKYKPNDIVKKTILPLFSIADNLSQEERGDIYKIVEEAVITQKETEKLSAKLKNIYIELKGSINDISKRLETIKKRLDNLNQKNETLDKGPNQKNQGGIIKKPELRPSEMGGNVISPEIQSNKLKRGNAMKYNQHSFPGEKPNFGLKLNKLFSSYITEYGPKFITMVISDSILYTNNLILRVSLESKDVLIGSCKSIKLYETEDNTQFLITEKPEVIPYGNKRGFYFKYITYEDILNLTNGDFYKVFNDDILKHYKETVAKLTPELKKVGYYRFD